MLWLVAFIRISRPLMTSWFAPTQNWTYNLAYLLNKNLNLSRKFQTYSYLLLSICFHIGIKYINIYSYLLLSICWPWSCIFRNWSRLGLKMYIFLTLQFTLLQRISSVDNECKCQILTLIYPCFHIRLLCKGWNTSANPGVVCNNFIAHNW